MSARKSGNRRRNHLVVVVAGMGDRRGSKVAPARLHAPRPRRVWGLSLRPPLRPAFRHGDDSARAWSLYLLMATVAFAYGAIAVLLTRYGARLPACHGTRRPNGSICNVRPLTPGEHAQVFGKPSGLG